MENAEKIHRQLALRPFRPFWIETKSGAQLRVERPEWFFEPPDGLGEFAIFDLLGYTLLNFRDVTSVVGIENPKQ